MNDKRKIIAIFIIVAIVAALAAVATFFVIKSAKNEAKGSSQMRKQPQRIVQTRTTRSTQETMPAQ